MGTIVDRPPTDDARAFSFVLLHLARSLGELYRTADVLCCSQPVLAHHLKLLADQCAADMGASLKQWPA